MSRKFKLTYGDTSSEVRIGDRVRVTENYYDVKNKKDVHRVSEGLVVCDFDRWECLHGHAYWLLQSDEQDEPGILDRGVMIEYRGQVEHFSCAYDPIELIEHQKIRNGRIVKS